MKATRAVLWISLPVIVALACEPGPGPDELEGKAISLAEALADRDPLTRPYGVAVALRDLRPDELDEALAALTEYQLGVTPEEVRQLMLAWARFDAPGAFAWASAWPTPWRRVLEREAAFAWGRMDGRAALRAVEALEEEERVGELRPAVMEGWIRSPDRAEVASFIAGLDDPRRRRRLTFLLTAEVRTGGEEAVQRWVEGLPDDLPNDFKTGAFYHAAMTIARGDPRAAAAWHAEHQDRRYSLGTPPGIARMWTEHHDAPAFLDWVRTLPAPDEERAADRGQAVRDGFRVWRMRDEAEAEAALVAALPDPILDPAVHEMVRRRTGSEPARAVEWALRIEDEVLRRRSLQFATDAWAQSDPAAVRAWAAGEQVPADLRARIERRLAEGAQVAPGPMPAWKP